jgi:polysaccharide export outer membrane protein
VSVAYNTLLNHPEENIYVLPGDVITVVRDPQTFTAFGATGRSEKIPFDTASITLEEAARAGGFNDDNAATPPGGNLVPVIYRLNLRDAHSSFLARAFAMKDKDMIYIANWASDQIGS